MQVISRDGFKSKKISNFHIETDELLKILKGVATEQSEVTMILGEEHDDEYTLLENLQEIEAHRSAISVPFTIKMDDVELSTDENGASLRYKSDNQQTALALEKALNEYKPWYRFVFSMWFIIAFFTFTIEHYKALS